MHGPLNVKFGRNEVLSYGMCTTSKEDYVR